MVNESVSTSRMSIEDERRLVAACRNGDQQAFAALVGSSRHVLWSVCREITGHAQDAEDAMQDALTAAWQNMDKFHGNSRFSTWLYRIATNAALAVRRRRRDEPTELEELETLTSSDYYRGPDERTVTIDAVRRAIADLPDDFQVAIVLREFADLTYADIAEHQGIPVQTVKSRINRARKRLTELLEVA